MAEFKLQATVKFQVYVALDEPQARALEALAGYGADEFIRQFYEHLGRHYMEPHEDGLRSLLKEIRRVIPAQLKQVDRAREALVAPEPAP